MMDSIKTATEVMYELRKKNMSKSTKRRLRAETVYILVKVDGYTYREAAKILGMKSPSTISFWLGVWEKLDIPFTYQG